MFESATSAEVLGLDPASLSDDELTSHLLAVIALADRAQAAVLAALGEWDARDLYALEGAVNPGQWLTHRGDLAGREARALTRHARALRATSEVAKALAGGVINVGQATALAAVRTPRTEAIFDVHEPNLVELARSLSVDDTIRMAQRWLLDADTDGPDPDNDDQSARMSPAYQGRWRLDANLNGDGGLIVHSELERIMQELFEAIAADGRPQGRATRLRADALVEMARRASAARPDQAAARPLIVVRTDVKDLVDLAGRAAPAGGTSAWTDDDYPISWTTLRRFLCDADICPVVTNGDWQILDVGRISRTATAAQRRALLIRDGGCVFPGCDRPPGWCEAHHIIWWEHDGPTDLGNLCLLCSRHHHEVHRGRFNIERRPDATLKFVRADGAVLQDNRGKPGYVFPATWMNPADAA